MRTWTGDSSIPGPLPRPLAEPNPYEVHYLALPYLVHPVSVRLGRVRKQVKKENRGEDFLLGILAQALGNFSRVQQ